MKKDIHDINDNEIRIVVASQSHTQGKSKRRNKLKIIIAAIAAICIVAIMALCYLCTDNREVKSIPLEEQKTEASTEQTVPTATDSVAADAKAYVDITNMVANGTTLTILTPRHASPTLQVGAESLNDSSAVLIVQAADIRRDNGNIVGAYVSEGKLLGKGQSKAGFCAIINGKPILGVADATPYLEQAIETDGYFFRQFPLVVGGQVVENKQKSSSLRKALVELNGEIAVVISNNKMTLNDFAQSLAGLGVTNAIYLVGSAAYGFAIDKAGERIEFGKRHFAPLANTNYIIWK